MFRSNADFVAFIRPTIERDDRSLLRRLQPYIHQAISSGLSRDELSRAVLDAFPDSELAPEIAQIILHPE
jgi:hypothetical protein